MPFTNFQGKQRHWKIFWTKANKGGNDSLSDLPTISIIQPGPSKPAALMLAWSQDLISQWFAKPWSHYRPPGWFLRDRKNPKRNPKRLQKARPKPSPLQLQKLKRPLRKEPRSAPRMATHHRHLSVARSDFAIQCGPNSELRTTRMFPRC